MDFQCPQCELKSFTTLRGWKSHMSREHGGYDESDVAQALSGAESSEGGVEQRMRTFAASIPSAAEEEVVEGPPSSGQEQPPPTTAPRVRTVKATPKKLKKILGAIPTKILEATDIELDDEDRQALDEAGEFLTDIFGVEFEVDQQKKVLHSRFWAIVWVAGVAVLIYVKHRFKDVWAKIFEQYRKQAMAEEEKEPASV